MKANAIKTQINKFGADLAEAFKLDVITQVYRITNTSDEEEALKDKFIVFKEELPKRDNHASNKAMSRLSFSVTYFNDSLNMEVYTYLENLENLGYTVQLDNINASKDIVTFRVF